MLNNKQRWMQCPMFLMSNTLFYQNKYINIQYIQ
jgi:hypothetical protein